MVQKEYEYWAIDKATVASMENRSQKSCTSVCIRLHLWVNSSLMKILQVSKQPMKADADSFTREHAKIVEANKGALRNTVRRIMNYYKHFPEERKS